MAGMRATAASRRVILLVKKDVFLPPNHLGIYQTSLRLVGLAFAGSIGMTLLIIACVMPGSTHNSWYPMFVILFYILAPLPTMLWKRYSDSTGTFDAQSRDLAIFFTMGVVISSFALPIVMHRAPVEVPTIGLGSCYLTLAANVVMYATYVGFFITLYSEDSDYSMW